MKKYFIVGFVLIFVILFLIVANPYQLKIELEIENKNVVEIDKNVAQTLENKILKLSEIQDVVSFSFIYGCEIYVKIKPFVFNKIGVISKIQRQIEPILNDFYYIKNVNFDENYAQDKNSNYQTKADYIYFSNNILLNYDLTLEDLKNIVQDNNLKKNFFFSQNDKNKSFISLNTNLKNIDDIKKIQLPYKNSKFSQSFVDVFEIKTESKEHFKSEILNRRKIFKNKYILSKNLDDNVERAQILVPKKDNVITYEILDYKLNKYHLTKKDVQNAILANTSGFKVTEYFIGSDKIEVFFKNTDDSDFVYSKKLKTLIPLDEIAKASFLTQYSTIARKNGRYMIIYKSKNPS